jgi:hypothetical protein
VELNVGSLGHTLVQSDGAQLDGNFVVQLASGYMPAVGNEFQVVGAAAGMLGVFDSIVLPTLAAGLAWDLNYNASSLALRVVLQGDYNRDNSVDGADYVIWRRMVNQTVINGDGADGNYDGVINSLDYAAWRANFGSSAASGTAQGAVPEPSGILLLAVGAVLVASQRLRRVG